jgi:hypothetical protein
LLPPLVLITVANLIISKGLKEGGTVSVSLKNGEFNFEVKSGSKKLVEKIMKPEKLPTRK